MPANSKRVSYATWQTYTPAQKAAKKKAIAASKGIPRVRGKGAYTYDKPGPWGRIGRVAGGMIGSALGSPYGLGKPGAAIGQKVGSLAHYIGRIFGSGDYMQSAPVKSNSILQPQAPTFNTKSGVATVNIRHREFLGDVITSSTIGGFSINSFPLNPGLSATFPWLSDVCGQSFQQYRINGMVFEFRSMSSDALNSTNTALGSVVMCTDYDSADAPFNSKQQMENTEFGVSCKPSSNMIHAIECAPRVTTATELYVRAFAPPSNTDIRLYDWGRTYIATTGFQAASVNIGELWVSYDITLIKAIEQPPGYLIPGAHYPLDTATLATLPVKPLGTGIVDTIGLTIASTGLTVVFPRTIPVNSKWSVILTHVSTPGAGAAAVTPVGIASSGGLVGSPRLFNSSIFGQSYPSPSPGPATSRSTGLEYFFTFSNPDPVTPPTLTFTPSVTPFNAYLYGDLIITQISSAF